MKLVIYTGNCVGNAKNCLYPTRREITSGAELAEAVKLDHVCASTQITIAVLIISVFPM